MRPSTTTSEMIKSLIAQGSIYNNLIVNKTVYPVEKVIPILDSNDIRALVEYVINNTIDNIEYWEEDIEDYGETDGKTSLTLHIIRMVELYTENVYEDEEDILEEIFSYPENIAEIICDEIFKLYNL